MILLDLPNELVIRILSNLTHQDLVACQLSNKQLYTIIKDSVLLQFKIALSTFKATDNPSCHLSLAERSQALKDSENAWTCLLKDFKRRIYVNHYEISGIYDLSGGVFLLGNAARTALHYIYLPSSPVDSIEWRKIVLDHSQGTIIDMGFCLDEHDLLVVVTTKSWESGTPLNTHDIQLVLFKLSTGEPYPGVKESIIHVLSSRWDRPGIGIEIVGERLVLILSYHNTIQSPDDRVFVYDWRNAVLKMSFSAPFCSYSGLIFLSENLIVIPNARTNALEIWDIFSTSQTPRPSCILQLPRLSIGNSLVYITCRGEPNPIGTQSRPHSKRPFYQSAHEAIMIFHVRVQLGDPLAHHHQHGGDLIFEYTYTIFVHRKALCQIYERRSNVPDPDLSVQVVDSDFLDSGLSEMIVDDDGTSNDPIPIPWVSWGPPVTRWFPTDPTSTRWITTTAGQRAVLIPHSHHGVESPYLVFDFNLENVQRAEKMLRSLPVDVGSRVQCFREMVSVSVEGVLEGSIDSELPYVVRASDEVHTWSGALMDEERVLGLVVEPGGRIRIIEVHHFGSAKI